MITIHCKHYRTPKIKKRCRTLSQAFYGVFVLGEYGTRQRAENAAESLSGRSVGILEEQRGKRTSW